MATPQKPKGIYSKGRGVAGINPDAKESNKEKYQDTVQTLRETAETKKDVGDTPGQMAAAGRKYKQDSTKDVDKFKKLVKEVTPKDVPASWNSSAKPAGLSRIVVKQNLNPISRKGETKVHPDNKPAKGN